MIDEKIKQIVSNYLGHTKKYILDHKKDFSSWKTIYHKFIKKDKIDPAFEYTKEVIKRMERDKMSSQTAMQISETLMPDMQNFKKEIIIMIVPLVIGVILLITFSLLFSFTRPFTITNHYIIIYACCMFASGILLGFGLFQRNKIKLSTLSKTIIFQAVTAYGASKMQGQGSFGAFRILEEMKLKQGKELQIRLTQPKIVYK